MSTLSICRSLLLGSALLATIFTPAAQAKRSYQVLHSFDVNDGTDPNGNLILDGAGNLYGTAPIGGAFNHGTIFRLSADGTFSVLYAFTGGDDGGDPGAGLTLDPATGDLYGTTSAFGKLHWGGVFKLTPAGKLVVLHDFSQTADGDEPTAAMILDKRGNLYGTTIQDGPAFGGAVFRLSSAGDFKVLHAFGGIDGSEPMGRLVRSGANLYGATIEGGTNNGGVIFKVTTDGTFTKLYNATQGIGLEGGMARDPAGNLYGPYSPSGKPDVIYALSPSGTYSPLYTFTGGTDGFIPYGDMLLSRHGTLYGTAARGGTGDNGTVFALDLHGNFTLLHDFAGAPGDGREPAGGLVRGKDGKLYGTTILGGANNTGVIFSVSAK